MVDLHEPKNSEPEKALRMRCGAPTEQEEDMLRRKCEGGIH